MYKTQEVQLYTPDSFLVEPCKAIDAGTTVRSLAKGYISNTSCIAQYKALIEKQKAWKAEQMLIYQTKKE